MIFLPESFWELLVLEFRRDKSNSERVAYFDGLRIDEHAIVTTLTFPNAERHPGYFRVSADAMSEAANHLLEFGLQRIAQVHSHGGRYTDHSSTDDAMAYSQRTGAISIVVPFHGKYLPELHECGVHEKSETKWVRLRKHVISQKILKVPSLVILRK